MEFKTDAQKACYEKITPWMSEIFGTFAKPRSEAPAFAIIMGSTLVHVFVNPWGDDDATIRVVSAVVQDVEVTPDLMKYLLEQNAQKLRFGAFGLEDKNILFEHTIVGSTCDKPELEASTKAVALTADRLDDEIVSRWGGKRAAD